MINASDIGTDKNTWSHTKTRHMCILSGCDYLDSLRGVGLTKAEKALTSYSDGYNVIKKWQMLGKLINAPEVTSDYEAKFRLADLTFKYQRVFDPISKEVVTLNEIKPNEKFPESSDFLGP